MPGAVWNSPCKADESGRGGQQVEKRLAIVASEDPVGEDDHSAAVAGPADEAAKTLLQAQSRLWQRELRERVAHALGTRGVHFFFNDPATPEIYALSTHT